jgi:hypothetical protein
MKRHSFLGDDKRVNIGDRPTPPSQLVGRGELTPRPTVSRNKPKKPLISPKVKAITVITLILLSLIFVPTFLGNIFHPNDENIWIIGLVDFFFILCGLAFLVFISAGLHVAYDNLVTYFNKKK